MSLDRRRRGPLQSLRDVEQVSGDTDYGRCHSLDRLTRGDKVQTVIDGGVVGMKMKWSFLKSQTTRKKHNRGIVLKGQPLFFGVEKGP